MSKIQKINVSVCSLLYITYFGNVHRIANAWMGADSPDIMSPVMLLPGRRSAGLARKFPALYEPTTWK